ATIVLAGAVVAVWQLPGPARGSGAPADAVLPSGQLPHSGPAVAPPGSVGATQIIASSSPVGQSPAPVPTRSPASTAARPAQRTVVSVDTVGRGQGSDSTLSWTQQVSGANRLLTAEVAVGAAPDTGCSLSVTDNGATMTRLTTVHDDNQPAGFHSVFYRVAPPTGTNTISATVTGCAVDVLTGGSISFTGASQSAPLGRAVTAAGDGTRAAATVAGTPSGAVAVGFVSAGTLVDSATTPSTDRFIENGDASTGAGNSGAATQAGSGGSNTLAWSVEADWWAVTAVSVLPVS
ncbi:MAG: hypothetical protein J2P15_21945, partial [Micromonosporaceae bacterium]|nr:hypothetical protein [Micromonosporaceae bacterium]